MDEQLPQTPTPLPELPAPHVPFGKKFSFWLIAIFMVAGGASAGTWYWQRQNTQVAISTSPSATMRPCSVIINQGYTLCLPSTIKLTKAHDPAILTAYAPSLPNKYMVEYSWDIDYQGKRTNSELNLYLQPKPGVTLEQLKAALPSSAQIIKANTSLGMGSEADVIESNKNELQATNSSLHMVTQDGILVDRLISDWGSDVSSDILAYKISSSEHSELFSNALIDVINIWGNDALDVPQSLTTDLANQLILQNDPKVSAYPIFDEMVRNSKWSLK